MPVICYVVAKTLSIVIVSKMSSDEFQTHGYNSLAIIPNVHSLENDVIEYKLVIVLLYVKWRSD